ncbi:F-box/LRR-repeat protein At3g03360-like [Salvia miltiorrhiza]|uniref:F-box/LRR-repeat protein At3g03360-like n=1 Tax=Salvia miltiorrhiza TaxID=226208 RepID=UPI0025ABBFDE|nr:F-box/LRR-repeat protein At3g03360-like [Salvia miltiorrhiza]
MEKSRKQKQKRMMGIDSNGGDIDRLPDDVVINILSHMSIKRAARTSVLAHKWRYLWRFSHGILRFDGKLMGNEKFESWVNGVLDLHQAPYIEGMIISFEMTSTSPAAVEKWLNFAVRKEVQRLELNLSFGDMYRQKFLRMCRYIFPTLDELRSHSHSHAFCRLRSLRLAHVEITVDVVHYFLASCPDLEELRIQLSYKFWGHLRVVDPPSLRVLEITRCLFVKSLEISAVRLVSLIYGGPKNSLLLKKAPNLRELCVRGDVCLFFVLEPKSYSDQLVKLVLDFRFPSVYRSWVAAPPDLPRLCSLKRLQVYAHTTCFSTLDIFTSLIEASPHLCEFRIELSCSVDLLEFAIYSGRYPLPHIEGSKVGKFVHRNLKVVEVGGYIGLGHAEELLVALISSCPSLERVAIHIPTDFYHDPGVWCTMSKCRLCKYAVPYATSREEAKGRAQRFIAKTRKQKPSLQEWKQCQRERLEFIVT